jgi:hypothetical protein
MDFMDDVVMETGGDAPASSTFGAIAAQGKGQDQEQTPPQDTSTAETEHSSEPGTSPEATSTCHNLLEDYSDKQLHIHQKQTTPSASDRPPPEPDQSSFAESQSPGTYTLTDSRAKEIELEAENFYLQLPEEYLGIVTRDYIKQIYISYAPKDPTYMEVFEKIEN